MYLRGARSLQERQAADAAAQHLHAPRQREGRRPYGQSPELRNGEVGPDSGALKCSKARSEGDSSWSPTDNPLTHDIVFKLLIMIRFPPTVINMTRKILTQPSEAHTYYHLVN